MTASHEDIVQIGYALNSLRPGSEWTLDHSADPLYDGLEWLDPNTTKPTEQEIESEVARLTSEQQAKTATPAPNAGPSIRATLIPL